MGKFLNRITGRSLQIGSGEFFNNISSNFGQNFQKYRSESAMNVKLPGTLQKAAFDARSAVKTKVNEMTGGSGVLQTGLVGNLIPHLRTIRLVPEPPASSGGTTTGMRRGYYPRQMQVPFEDIQALQFKPDEIEALGNDAIRINVN